MLCIAFLSGYMLPRTEKKLSYIESGGNYSDRINLSEEELEDVHAVCSSDAGKVFLQITQDDRKKTVDITNADILLERIYYWICPNMKKEMSDLH